MARFQFLKVRFNSRAFLDSYRAPSSKSASRRRVDRRRDVTREDNAFTLLFRVGMRDRGKQGLCVRVQRAEIELLRCGYLDDLSEIHYGDAIRNMLDN